MLAQWFAAQTAEEEQAEKAVKQERRNELIQIGAKARARIQRMPYILALYCQLKCEDLRG